MGTAPFRDRDAGESRRSIAFKSISPLARLEVSSLPKFSPALSLSRLQQIPCRIGFAADLQSPCQCKYAGACNRVDLSALRSWPMKLSLTLSANFCYRAIVTPVA